MKRYVWIPVLLLGVVFIVVIAGKVKEGQKSVIMSREQVNEEMPQLLITENDRQMMDAILNDSEVNNFLVSSESVEFPLEQAYQLSAGRLPEDARISELSISGQSVCLDYFHDGLRIILEVHIDQSIHKTVSDEPDEDNRQVSPPVYTNFNNEVFTRYRYR